MVIDANNGENRAIRWLAGLNPRALYFWFDICEGYISKFFFLDRTGSNHRPDHGSDHGSDHGLDHGSDHEPKKSIFWKIKKKRIVYN